MATGVNTRENGGMPYAVHAMQIDVSFDTPGITTGIPFTNYIPQDAQFMQALVNIKTAFNAASTNVLTVGTNSTSFNNIVAAADVDESTTGVDIVDTGAELDTSSGPLMPYVKYTESGTAASAGRAIITLLYVPKIDR